MSTKNTDLNSKSSALSNSNIKIYMAPLEGITGYIFRNEYEKHFGKGKINKYFIPFISPNKSNGYTTREQNDIMPAHNKLVNTVPQIMANDSNLFIKGADMLMDMGYREINLNLGCPSGTVVSKFRGSGFLAKPDELDKFLNEIFDFAEKNNLKISLKTRTGLKSHDEFDYLLTVFNQYPYHELIVHPRVREDYYNNCPDMTSFRKALERSGGHIGYNGDIFTKADFDKLLAHFCCYTNFDSIMLGRGLIGNPGLIDELVPDTYDSESAYYQTADDNNICGTNIQKHTTADFKKLKTFLDDVFAAYLEIIPDKRNAIHKMKEIWIYINKSFPGTDKACKAIKKAQNINDYMAACDTFFATIR